MRRPVLTIILFRDAEKGPEYLELYLGALREWNRAGLDRAEIIVISQAADSSDVHAICARQPFGIDVVHARGEIVEGYPIWDALAAVRLVWPLVRGRYVTVHHTEFIWGPDRLTATIEWLERVRPYYAIGNLRRPGTLKEISNPKAPTDCVRSVSDSVSAPMLAGDWAEAGRQFELIPTTHWMYWSPEQRPGVVPYIEDIFFAHREWLDSWQWTEHRGELPFQDVFDLMGQAMKMLGKRGLAPVCVRMRQVANRTVHLWHEKAWAAWTPAVRDWFLSDPERWRDTRFLDRDLWDRLIAARGQSIYSLPRDPRLVHMMRFSPGGTAIRYAVSLSEWLRNGGGERVDEFYERYGREKRGT